MKRWRLSKRCLALFQPNKKPQIVEVCCNIDKEVTTHAFVDSILHRVI